MRDTQSLVLGSGAVAFLLSATVTILTILDSVASGTRLRALAVVAAALDVVALVTITLSLALVARRASWIKDNNRSSWRRTLPPALFGLLGLAAAAVTLTELTLNRRSSRELAERARMAATIGLCGGAALVQTIFYILSVVLGDSTSDPHHTGQQQRPLTSDERARPMSLRILTPPRALIRHDSEEKQSPLMYNDSATSLSTLRASVNQAVRPITSKTRLVRTPTAEQSHLCHSLRSSIDSLNRGDAFDSWDTSDVDLDAREAVLSGRPRRKGGLEPIPGSRPGSPGRPLEGPFLEPSLSTDSSPTSGEPTSSPYSYRPDTAHSYEPRIRYNDSRVSIDSTRPDSPTPCEAHIHPLFRTDSPTPPPAHTPNTVIVASPIAGSFIPPPPRAFSRMGSRDGMRSASPSPLIPSKNFVSGRASVASSAPPSRPVTPPIPEYVMGGAK